MPDDTIGVFDELPVEYETLQRIVSNQFGLFVSKFKPAHYDGYIGQSQYSKQLRPKGRSFYFFRSLY